MRPANPPECRVTGLYDPKVDTRVARLAARQHGVLSLDELFACGLTAQQVKVRTRNGHLHRIHRGVYAVGHTNLTLEGRFLAAVKACGPSAALSHFSAAALWGFMSWEERHPEVTLTNARQHPGINAHRSRTLTRDDVTRHKGIRVTTPARTLHDLSSKLPFKSLRRAARQAQALKLIAPHRLPPKLIPHAAPTRSALEDAVLDLIMNAGFEPPQVNPRLKIQGRRIIPDLRWPAQRLCIEADSLEWHDNPIAREDDAERQAILEADGERVVRVTWDQATRRPAETLARIRRAGAPKLQGP
jgi:very-short-patch-repair endonuclease